MNTITFTEEYVFDDVTITRYQLKLKSTASNTGTFIKQHVDEIRKNAAEKALHDRVAFLERENAELRAKLQG